MAEVDQGKRITGSVKWFSNKKCFGFITPDEGTPSAGIDVFVHQSSIHSEGFRTLREAWNVEFTIGVDESGRLKAENVTSIGGGPCTGPRGGRGNSGGGQMNAHENDVGGEYAAEGGVLNDGAVNGGDGGGENGGGDNRRRRRRGKGDGANNHNNINNANGENSGGGEGVLVDGGGEQQVRNGRGRNGGRNRRSNNREPKIAQPFWHEILEPSVKSGLQIKDISMATGTIDVSVGKNRIKLGTGGYASMASADGLVAEGTFLCNADGIASLTWNKVIQLMDGVWLAQDPSSKGLPVSVSLMADDVLRVGPEETERTLWGDAPAPRSALEENGFLMRRIVLTPRRRNT